MDCCGTKPPASPRVVRSMRSLPTFSSAEGRKANVDLAEDDFREQQIDGELRIIRNMIDKGKLLKLKGLTNEAILKKAKEEFPNSLTHMSLASLRSSLTGGGKKRPKNKTKKKRSRKKSKKKTKKKRSRKKTKKN